VGIVLLPVALILLLSVFRAYGRGVQRSHYRHTRWDRRDTWIALPSLLALGITLLVGAFDKFALIYYPYPPYPLAPEFNAWIGLVLGLLSLPGLVALYEGDTSEESGARVEFSGRADAPVSLPLQQPPERRVKS